MSKCQEAYSLFDAVHGDTPRATEGAVPRTAVHAVAENRVPPGRVTKQKRNSLYCIITNSIPIVFIY